MLVRLRRAIGMGPKELIERAVHAAPALVQDVRVDHGCPHVTMSEQLLHGSDVIPVLEKMRRERVSERVARDVLGNA